VRILNASIAIAVTVLMSCASTVPMATPAADAEAKSSKPANGMARIFVVRKAQGFGRVILFHADVDGKAIGGLAPNTYRFVDVAPGTHTVRVYGLENEELRSVDLVADGKAFVVVHVRTGFSSARVGLDPVTADGVAFVQAAALAQ